MAFPDLSLTASGGVLHSTATGIPANGNNTFLIGIDPDLIDDTNWLVFDVTLIGASVTAASYVSISSDKTQVTFNFTQSGAGTAKVDATMIHSMMR